MESKRESMKGVPVKTEKVCPIKVNEGDVLIGMDPSSTRNCGFAVVKLENNAPKLLAKFTLEITREQSDFGRYRDIYNKLVELKTASGAKVLCVERAVGGGFGDYQFARANINETMGVAKLACYDNGIQVYEVSPAHLKSVVAGHGRAKKPDIKKNIMATFGLKTAGAEHECDAAACALSLLVDAGMPYEVKVPYIAPPTKKRVAEKGDLF